MSTFDNEQLQIDTPENIIFGFRRAGLGSRFFATLIDQIILIFLQGAVVAIGLATSGIADSLISGLSEQARWAAVMVTILVFIIFIGYYIFFEMIWNGQTPGRRYMKLRVIGRDGLPITLSASLIRNLVRLVDFFPTFYGLGVTTMFIDRQQRRLGDMAAGTLVITEEKVKLHELSSMPYQNYVPDGIDQTSYPLMPVERLTEEDVALVQEWFERRNRVASNRAFLRPLLTRLYSQMEIELEDQVLVDEATNRLGYILLARRGS